MSEVQKVNLITRFNGWFRVGLFLRDENALFAVLVFLIALLRAFTTVARRLSGSALRPKLLFKFRVRLGEVLGVIELLREPRGATLSRGGVLSRAIWVGLLGARGDVCGVVFAHGRLLLRCGCGGVLLVRLLSHLFGLGLNHALGKLLLDGLGLGLLLLGGDSLGLCLKLFAGLDESL